MPFPKGRVSRDDWISSLAVYQHGTASRLWRQSFPALLLYASLLLFLPEVHASDLLATVQQSCVRPYETLILHSCGGMRSGDWQVMSPRLAFASMLHACVGDGSPNPRPLRIIGPNGTFTRTLMQLTNSNTTFFTKMTGIPIKYEALPSQLFSSTRKKQLTDPSPPNATNGYDAILLSPSAYGDADQVPGKLLDLSLLVANDANLDWEGFPPPLRANMVTYDNAIVALPLLPVPWFTYYHLGIFQRDGLTPPRTWEEFTDLAERYHGKDGLIGACIWMPNCRAESLVLRYILASYVQTHGPNQGILLDSETLEPLVNTQAMVEAMKILRRLRKVGIYNSAHGQPCIPRDFNVGKCLLTISEAGEFKTVNLEKLPMRGLLGMAPMPGSIRVLDRTTRQLVTCDPTRCPLAQDSIEQDGQLVPVNRAPYILNTVILFNGLSPSTYQFLAYTFFAYLTSPSVIGTKAMLMDANDVLPVRTEDMDPSNAPLWVNRGYDAGDVERFLPLFKRVLESPNPMVDLKTHFSSNVTNALLKAGLAALNTTIPEEDAIRLAIQSLESDLQTIVDREGRENFANQYRRSLNWVAARPAPAPVTSPQEPREKRTWLLPVAVAVPCGVALLLAMALTGFLLRARRRRKAVITAVVALRRPPMLAPLTTLVVTDIQDSTALWEALDAYVMDASLKLHHRVLRAALLDHHGYESATEGDSFILAFHHPTHAVAFCVAAQQALLEAPWPRELLHRAPLASALEPWDDPAGIVTMIHRQITKPATRTRSAVLNQSVGGASRRKVPLAGLPSGGAESSPTRASSKAVSVDQPASKEPSGSVHCRAFPAYHPKPEEIPVCRAGGGQAVGYGDVPARGRGCGQLSGSGGRQPSGYGGVSAFGSDRRLPSGYGRGNISPGSSSGTAFGAGNFAWALPPGASYCKNGTRGGSAGQGRGLSGKGGALGFGDARRHQQALAPQTLPLSREGPSVSEQHFKAPQTTLNSWLSRSFNLDKGSSSSGIHTVSSPNPSAPCALGLMCPLNTVRGSTAQLAVAVTNTHEAGGNSRLGAQQMQRSTLADGDSAAVAVDEAGNRYGSGSSISTAGSRSAAEMWLPTPPHFKRGQGVTCGAGDARGRHLPTPFASLSGLRSRGNSAKQLTFPAQALGASEAGFPEGACSGSGYPRSAATATPLDHDLQTIQDGAVPEPDQRSMSTSQIGLSPYTTMEGDSEFQGLPARPAEPSLPQFTSGDEDTSSVPVPKFAQRPPTSQGVAAWALSGSGSLGQITVCRSAPRRPVSSAAQALQAQGDKAEQCEKMRQQEWQLRCGISRVSLLFSLRQKWEVLPQPTAAAAGVASATQSGDDAGAGNLASITPPSGAGTAQTRQSTAGWAAGGDASFGPPPADSPALPSTLSSGGSRNRGRLRGNSVTNELAVVVYRGLRVRMGCVCTVYPGSDALRNRTAGGRMQYSGTALRMAKAVSDAAHGGMVIFADCVYNNLCSDAAASAKALQHVQLLWLGRHRLADDLPAVHLIQAVAHGSAMVGRLALQRPPRSLTALLPPGSIGALAAPVIGSGVIARVAVPTAAALLAWDHHVAQQALELLHSTLLETLSWVLDDVPYVAEGVMGLAGLQSPGSVATTAGVSAAVGKSDDAPVSASMWPRYSSISEASTYLSFRPYSTAGGPARASDDGGSLSSTPGPDSHGGEVALPDNSPRAVDGQGTQALVPWPSQASLPKRGAMSRLDARSKSQSSLQLTAITNAAVLRAASPSAQLHRRIRQGREIVSVSKAGGGTVCAGSMAVVFRDPHEAARWLLSVMETLPSLSWPPELLEHPLCEELLIDSLDVAEHRGRGPNSGQPSPSPRMTGLGVQLPAEAPGAPASAPTPYENWASKRAARRATEQPPSGSTLRFCTQAAVMRARAEGGGMTPRSSGLGKGAGAGTRGCPELEPAPLGAGAGAGALDGSGGTAAAGEGTLLVLRGLRARAAFVYGELEGDLPAPGGLSCQVSYRGRAWLQSAVTLARSKPGRVATNAETAVLLSRDVASRLLVLKGTAV